MPSAWPNKETDMQPRNDHPGTTTRKVVDGFIGNGVEG